MAIEKKWPAVAPRLFTANGTVHGVVTLQNARGFKVKQKVVVKSNTRPDLQLQVKRVYPTQLILGPIPTKQGEQPLTSRTDLTAYTTADGAYVYAEEQDKSTLKPDDILQAIYRQEPSTSIGVELTDEFGNPINSQNPLPTTATISGDVTIGTDGFDPTDPDSMLATGSEDGTKTGVKHALRVDSSGRLLTQDIAAQTILNAIALQLTEGILKVDDDASQALLTSILARLSAGGLQIGTEDGTPTGVQHIFVNNFRTMILDSHDRQASFSYADFGTKNQRVTGIDYASATFPSVIVRRQFAYTLVGNNYRRDSETWTIV